MRPTHRGGDPNFVASPSNSVPTLGLSSLRQPRWLRDLGMKTLLSVFLGAQGVAVSSLFPKAARHVTKRRIQ